MRRRPGQNRRDDPTITVNDLAVQLAATRLAALRSNRCLPVMALKMCVSRYRQAPGPG
nr:hypothetical protein KitaXyl93_23350 [Kitasatospora sp. Xyl93]